MPWGQGLTVVLNMETAPLETPPFKYWVPEGTCWLCNTPRTEQVWGGC